jgi:uncharacterized protein YjbI with pentapeptide repeats
MAISSSRWLRRIGIAIVIAALVLPLVLVVALPEAAATFVTKITRLIPPPSLPLAIVLIAQATLLLVAAIWWLWWRLPRRQLHKLDVQIHDPKARADTEDNFRKTVGQALGGGAVLIGAAAAYLQFTQQQQTAYQQLKASQDLLISNQVSKGFEQLAGEKMEMRLGGIYALEGVMNAPNSRYGGPVLEALCAFVRDHTAIIGPLPAAPMTDVQAVLTVIGRRNPGPGRVDLAGTNIPGAYLNEALLKDVILVKAHLEGAVLAGAHLEGGHLPGAHLEGALLYAVHLETAYLNEAHLEGAALIGAYLEHAKLAGAHLEGAALPAAHLEGANLFQAHLERADLHGAHLEGADLSQAHLERADLHGAYLEGADLSTTEGLTQAQIDDAYGDAETKLPPGLTR